MGDLFSICINYILYNNLKFTEKEVADFLNANPITEVDGKL